MGVTVAKFKELALSFEGTEEAPHFDRTAFKARRIFATLAGDGKTANIRFTPEEQEHKCNLYPEAFSPIPNKWGAQGWTVLELKKLNAAELKTALEAAWTEAQRKKRGTEKTVAKKRASKK